MPKNLSDCDDTEVIIRGLGRQSEIIDIKAAGTAMRFMTAYLSATDGEYTITGNGAYETPSNWYSCGCTALFRGRD